MSLRKGNTIIGGKGTNGTDGFSPTANVNKIGNTATITITDKDGTTTSQVQDGASYTLPVASDTVLGGVKVGENLSVEEDGKLNAKDSILYYYRTTLTCKDKTFADTTEFFSSVIQSIYDGKEVFIINNINMSVFQNCNQIYKLQQKYNLQDNSNGRVYFFTEYLDSSNNAYAYSNIYIDYTIANGVASCTYTSGNGYNKKLALRYYGYGAGALLTDNTNSYTPTADYNPATKKYVDDKLTSLTGYDATKTQVLKNVEGVLTWVDEI